MIPSAAQWNTPQLSIEKETIVIQEGNKKFRFLLNNISNMYLRPRKGYSFTAILGTIFAMNDKTYTLCVKTRDDKEYKIRVNGYDKQIYVNLISHVRRTLRSLTPVNAS